jgi:hypothetical protein
MHPDMLKVIIFYFINVFVAKLGTAATGKFLSGKRERASVQSCQIKQDFMVAKKALKFIKKAVGPGAGEGVGSGGWGGGLTLARHA